MNVQINNTPVAPTASDTSNVWEQEFSTLKEELAAQDALRAREREQKKAMEEEKQKMESF